MGSRARPPRTHPNVCFHYLCIHVAPILFLGMLAATVAPVAAWFVGTFFSGTRHCTCEVSIGSLPEPSAGVLELLREQLQRCGPEQLRTSSIICPVAAPCPAIGFDYSALVGGIVIGFALAVGLAFFGALWFQQSRAATPSLEDSVRAVSPSDLARTRRPPNAR